MRQLCFHNQDQSVSFCFGRWIFFYNLWSRQHRSSVPYVGWFGLHLYKIYYIIFILLPTQFVIKQRMLFKFRLNYIKRFLKIDINEIWSTVVSFKYWYLKSQKTLGIVPRDTINKPITWKLWIWFFCFICNCWIANHHFFIIYIFWLCTAFSNLTVRSKIIPLLLIIVSITIMSHLFTETLSATDVTSSFN